MSTIKGKVHLERQLGPRRGKFGPSGERSFLAVLLAPLPRQVRVVSGFWYVRPDTVLRWHHNLAKRRHARIRPKRPGRPRTVRSIRALVLCVVRENSGWDYRRIHGELAVLGITVAPSTVWEILKTEGVDPASERTATTWASFLRPPRPTTGRPGRSRSARGEGSGVQAKSAPSRFASAETSAGSATSRSLTPS
ncbi:hypothetical protein [Streptomyces sp. NPDC047009]|uniref:hypothetical protein n=1 Tax=unclassified Streptomyces TaxID=2593676 RepID=UPI0033E107A1